MTQGLAFFSEQEKLYRKRPDMAASFRLAGQQTGKTPMSMVFDYLKV